MSAAPRPTSDLPVNLDPDRWIGADEAARILKMHRKHLVRICREKLSPQGLAQMARPEQGGNARWYILRTYNAALAPGLMGRLNQWPEEYDRLADDKKRSALQRVNCVEQLREARVSWKGDQKVWLPRLLKRLTEQYADLKISRSSVLRWDKLYGSPSDIMSLVDRRGGKVTRDGEAFVMFRGLFLTDHQRTKIDCWRLVEMEAKAKGWLWLSYTQLCRVLDQWIPPEEQTRFRRPTTYRREFQPYIEKDVDAWQAGTCWEGDHRQMNIIVRYGKRGQLLRPWLTAWMDRRSRRIAGWTLSPSPNSSGILAALRHGIMDEINCGGPDVVWIDNGKDYQCRTLHGATRTERRRLKRIKIDDLLADGLFKACGIKAHFAIPHNPNGKSFIEGWFDTLEPFDAEFATYVARKPGDKPESIKHVLKDEAKIPSFERVLSCLTDHIAGYNSATGLDRQSRHMHKVLDGLSPDQYLAERCPRRKVMPDKRTLDLLMMQLHKPVRVHRNGVSIAIAGMRRTYGQFDASLRPLKPGKGKKGALVRVQYDPLDVSRVVVFREDGGLIGELKLNGMTGRIDDRQTEEDVRDLMREKRRYNNAKKTTTDGRHFEFMTPAALHARKRREENAPKPTSDAPLKIIQTGFEEAAEKLERQRSRRKAAGAEHDMMPDIGSWRVHDGEFVNTDNGDVLQDLSSLSSNRNKDLGDEPFELNLPGPANAGNDEQDTDVLLDLTTLHDAGEDADDDGHFLDEL